MTLGAALENLIPFGAPVLIYALYVRLRLRVSLAELFARLGLGGSAPRFFAWAALGLLPTLVFCAFNSPKMDFEGSMLRPFIGAEVSWAHLASALIYGFIATGFPEELLFRGLIGGALFRRLRFQSANLTQATIFLLPHALLLLVAPALWPMLIFVMVLGLALGWLRARSGSIWPGVLLHAGGNVIGVLVVLRWG